MEECPACGGARASLRRRLSRRLRGCLAVAALALGVPWGAAQTLAEVQLVAAAALQLDPAVSLPRGSYRALGPGTATVLAKVPGSGAWSDWEVFSATGLAARLQPAFVQQVVTAFAAAGYFQSAASETVAGAEVHQRFEFEGESGRALLYVIRTPEELVWLTARAR